MSGYMLKWRVRCAYIEGLSEDANKNGSKRSNGCRKTKPKGKHGGFVSYMFPNETALFKMYYSR
jgi:hypothetical protein